MKITKQRLKEIIIEEYQKITEKTVRLSQWKDANFVPGQWVQLVGRKGMLKLTKKDKHGIVDVPISKKLSMGSKASLGSINYHYQDYYNKDIPLQVLKEHFNLHYHKKYLQMNLNT